MSDKIHTLDDFLLLLKGVKPGSNGEYSAICPVDKAIRGICRYPGNKVEIISEFAGRESR